MRWKVKNEKNRLLKKIPINVNLLVSKPNRWLTWKKTIVDCPTYIMVFEVLNIFQIQTKKSKI